MLLFSWLGVAPDRVAALNSDMPVLPIAQPDASPVSALAEPVVLLLLGLLLATVGILARRSSEKRLVLKSRASRDL
jgi:hypothetical protein